MPFTSKAQRRKVAELLVEGKITPEAYEEWNRETGSKKLPERVKPKSKRSSKTRKKTKAKARPKARSRAEAKTRPKSKSRRKTGK